MAVHMPITCVGAPEGVSFTGMLKYACVRQSRQQQDSVHESVNGRRWTDCVHVVSECVSERMVAHVKSPRALH
jgi:hypothetical protein